MVSKYFELNTASESFKKRTEALISELAGKKILLYGAGAGFLNLDRKYHFKERLNIVAISDKKFSGQEPVDFQGIKAISPQQITKEKFDLILITNEKSELMMNFLQTELGINTDIMRVLFKDEIKGEAGNINYLYKQKFDKTLPKLIKKLKNKTVILYGAGTFLEVVTKYFDLSPLNILGIADKKYSNPDREKEFLGYKTIAPEEILNIKPDYVVVSTLFYVKIIEDLHKNLLKKSKIRIKPLVDKPFMELFSEIQKMS